MVAAYPILLVALGLLLAATGAYMGTKPRRLFTRADDPAGYRPEAVELDSADGRWLTRTVPPVLILAGLALAAFSLIRMLSE